MRRLILIVITLVAAFALSACADDEAPRLELTGSVVDDVSVVPVPGIVMPTVDLKAGWRESTATPSPDAQGAGGPISASTRQCWTRVVDVSVRPGDMVQAGQEIARIDDAFLRLGVQAAKAEAATARANVTLLDDSLTVVMEGRSEIGTKTTELDRTISDLESQRAEIANQLASAKTALTAATTATETVMLTTQIAALEPALARIEAGLEQARTGRSTLASATADLNAAQTRLAGIRAAVDAVVEARNIAVSIAEHRLQSAVILAPAQGTVVDARQSGEVVACGAPLVTLRLSSATRVETYVTAEQGRALNKGTQATVYVDALPGRGQPAHVVYVADELEFVPTTFATKLIHLTRGVRVVVELDGTRWIAPGTPADVRISVK
ncbi:MAG: HlyD family secretion protein [Coriobacteriia bacterium]